MTSPRFSLDPLDIVIVAGTLLAVVAVGLWASRNPDRTARGYFLASGRLPWWIIGSAFVSTSVSSEQIVGTVGKAYEHGMGIANWEWFTLPMYAPLILFFIPVYLRSRVTTISEFLSRRYGPRCGDVYGWVMLVAYVLVFLVPVLYGGTLVISRLTGWNFYAVLWGMVALVGAYTIKGGLLSVMWTDALQCAMLLGGGIVLYVVALDRIPGGWSALVEASPQRFHLYCPPDDPWAPFTGLLCGAVGVYLFYSSTNQVMIQRVLAARSTWDGMMGIVFAGFINFARPLVTCFLGFIVYHWIHVLHRAPPLADPDHAFPFALVAFDPPAGLRGVILAGFLAAVMSTVSALANSTATIFAMDVYRKLFCPDADDRRLVRTGRWASVNALLVAAAVCPVVSQVGIFPYFQTGVTYLSIPFVSVFLLGVFWRRANYAGGLFGVIAGLVLSVACLFAPFAGIRLHWLYIAFIAQVVAMVGIVAVSLLTPPPERSQWEPFHWTPALLSGYDEGVVRPWYQSVKLWFGLYVATWVFLYWHFW